MDSNNRILSKILIQHFEETYYSNINSMEVWHELLISNLKKNEDLIKNIETLASNGIANLKIFIEFVFEKFDFAYHSFITEKTPTQFPLIKWYLEIICYFHNFYSVSKQTEVTFFYQDTLKNTLDLISHEHKEQIESFNQSNPVIPIRELLTLPFIMNHFIVTNQFNRFLDLRNTILSNYREILSAYYHNIDQEAFLWLDKNNDDKSISNALLTTTLIFHFLNQVDSLCGSKKMFGYYQRTLNIQSGNVIYSIPYSSQMFLLKGTSALIAGQANIDSVEFLSHGRLLISFKHGLFLDDAIISQVSFNVAFTINEALSPYFALISHLTLLLETSHDNPQFAEMVKAEYSFLNPDIIDSVIVVPSLKSCSKIEKDRYLKFSNSGTIFTQELKDKIINNIKLAGHKNSFVFPDIAFKNVKIIELKPGDKLITEGDSSVFVYIPFNEGISVSFKGNNTPFFPKPWIPIGHIGVLQNDKRTANIIAEKQVTLLMIPGDTYLQYWHIDYTLDELRKRLLET